MALTLTIRGDHCGLIQAALDRREAGDDAPLYGHIMRALKGRLPGGEYRNIRPATRSWVDREGKEQERNEPGFPHRSWAYKDECFVALGRPYAEKVEGALKEAAKSRGKSRDGSDVPAISAAQADALDDLLSVIVPAWKNGDAIKNTAPLAWDSREAAIIAKATEPLSDIPAVDYGGTNRIAEAAASKPNGGA